MKKMIFTHPAKQYLKIKRMVPILLLGFMAMSFTNVKSDTKQVAETEQITPEHDSLKKIIAKNTAAMEQQIITSLTFQKNDAEQAMNLYVSLFDNSKILSLQRWGKEGPGKEGTIMQATFEMDRNLCVATAPRFTIGTLPLQCQIM